MALLSCPRPAALKTCIVSFRTSAGEWVRVVSDESVFEAASKALEFFASDGWYGPQPRSESVLEISADRRRASVPSALRSDDRVAGGNPAWAITGL